VTKIGTSNQPKIRPDHECSHDISRVKLFAFSTVGFLIASLLSRSAIGYSQYAAVRHGPLNMIKVSDARLPGTGWK
jgi:hypothetical protein